MWFFGVVSLFSKLVDVLFYWDHFYIVCVFNYIIYTVLGYCRCHLSCLVNWYML